MLDLCHMFEGIATECAAYPEELGTDGPFILNGTEMEQSWK